MRTVWIWIGIIALILMAGTVVAVMRGIREGADELGDTARVSATPVPNENTEVSVTPPQGQVTTRPTARVSPTTSASLEINIYLIKMEDNGKSGTKIGCNDSAIAVKRTVPRGEGILKAAIEELLSIKQRDFQGGLINTVYHEGEELTLDRVTIVSGKANIYLTSNNWKFIGTCEDARFMAQFEQTAKQFSTVREVEIFLNGESLRFMYTGPTVS
jgi:hypothetical protein